MFKKNKNFNLIYAVIAMMGKTMAILFKTRMGKGKI